MRNKKVKFMASGVTDRGRAKLLNYAFDGTTAPTTFYYALCTDATTPTVATNLFSDLTEIATGNGYAQFGNSMASDTAFTVTEVDGTPGAKVVLSNQEFTGSGGTLPSSGSARWAVLLDTNATSANVLAWFDLSANTSVSDGQTLSINASTINVS